MTRAVIHIAHRALLAGLVVCAGLAFGLSPSAQAQAAVTEAVSGALPGAALRQALRDAGPGRPLRGATINGDALVAVIREAEHPIHIDGATIVGGLVWPTAGPVPVEIKITDSTIQPSAITRRLTAGTAISARGVTFQAPVDFTGTTFLGPADFGQARFQKKTAFRNVRAVEGLRFDGAEFDGHAGFQGLQAEGALGFAKARFADRASFSKAVLAGADFRETQFAASANFGGVTFGAAARFTGARFEGTARFDRASFAEAQIFDNHFIGRATFTDTTFAGNAVFRAGDAQTKAQFGGGATFFRTHIDGYAEFNHLSIPGALAIIEATIDGGLQMAFTTMNGSFALTRGVIGGPSNFDRSTFNGAASFDATAFHAETTVRAARFAASAVFQGACFADTLALQNSDLGAYADFRGATINRLDLLSHREPTLLQSRLDLRGAAIAEAAFEDVIFQGPVDLSDARVGGVVPACGDTAGTPPERPGLHLRFVTFEDAVSAQRATFSGHVAMFGTKFAEGVDFTNAVFPTLGGGDDASFSLAYSDFGDLRLRWDQLPDPWYWRPAAVSPNRPAGASDAGEPVSSTLATLEGLFRARQLLADANAATYARKRIALREARAGGWTADRLQQEIEWLLWGVTCGYGTKIGWIIGWALLLNLVFTLIYWRWARIDRRPHPAVTHEFSFRLRLLDLPGHYGIAADTDAERGVPSDGPRQRHKLVDALRVSSVILFKVGYRDTSVSGAVGPVGMGTVVAVEWVIGFVVLAAFTVTLSNTQPLINRLVSGVL